MDDQVFELLNDKINKVEQKVDLIGVDVKEMLSFKWQIVGGSVVISLIIGLAIQLILGVVNK